MRRMSETELLGEMDEQESEEIFEEDLFNFELPDPALAEMIVVVVVRDENGNPAISMNGNVDDERAALLLQMAGQISLENVVFNYLPEAGFQEGEDEDEEDAPEQEAADRSADRSDED